MKKIQNTTLWVLILWLGMGLWSCRSDSFQPTISSIEPEFGPEETLVTIQGEHLAEIQSITFSGVPINFNTAYNADHALLFRIPSTVPLGDHEVVLTTELGEVKTDFRVTREAPELFGLFPESGGPGDEITIRGKNFFEPLEVYFFDSVPANIVRFGEDSLVVEVPEGIEKGFVRVNANGGSALSPQRFFTVGTVLINDFDGNGLRAETNKWVFVGSINENATNAVQNQNPAPFEGNYLKLSGSDDLDILWIGGAQNHFGFPGDEFETYGIRTTASNTLLELDVHNNGRDNTHIILILREKDGSINDFTFQLQINGDGWNHLSIPLTRFKDLNGAIVDPQKVNLLKIHLIDADKSGSALEVNVDNLKFLELL
ncbi:MAG: IPT/TIG domain-containing protein [Bacteroidia bacterium]|nr:IPT/TIG domain-containing protein [Bacteroidia bacterium]